MNFKEIFSTIFRVAKREMKIMYYKPLYFYSTIIVFFVSCIFFLSLLHEGATEDMPIAVVDLDQTSISRRLVHELNSTQGVQCDFRCATFEEARIAMQQGEVYAILVIPKHFYSEMLDFKRPTLTFYTNMAYTLAGTTAYKQLLSFANMVSGAFQREVLRKKGLPDQLIMQRIQPITVDGHMLANPTSNYAVYLCSILLPGILGLIVLIITIYTLGMELKWKTSRELMAEAKGNIILALGGKFLPHTILYCMMGISLNLLLFRILQFPMMGDLWTVNVAVVCLVLAMQAMGIVIVGLLPVLRDAISIGALYGMMGFSCSGFTFPVTGMLPAFRGLVNIFPLRHYFRIYSNEALMGNPFVDSLPIFIYLVIFMILPLGVMIRLRNAFINQNYPLK
ncbi:MAG: ABC transporter permease [Paludibacteraceae bacterium]|nr:ABC transporter permease [Candidatus Colicola equi]MCQ2339868.1 ABC transporter permease [Paludibacteraceae bacterium]